MRIAKLTTAFVVAIVLGWTNPAAGLVVFDYAEDWEAPGFLEFEVSTDQCVYEPGEPIQVDVTVLNTSQEDYTLEFSSSHQAGYVMDRTYDWADGREFLDVITYQEVPAEGSHTWTFDHDWEAYRPEGISEIIGYVPGYGWSEPAMFKVVAEDGLPVHPKPGDMDLQGIARDGDRGELKDFLARKKLKGVPGNAAEAIAGNMGQGGPWGPTLVPEPATLGLLTIGGLSVLLRRRR